jgi:hypothetical protein
LQREPHQGAAQHFAELKGPAALETLLRSIAGVPALLMSTKATASA